MAAHVAVVFVVLSVILVSAVNTGDVTSRVVVTEQGPVRGYLNHGLFEFLGIPYASIPSKQYRYQSPFPPKVRANNTILEAVDRGIICTQGVNIDIDIHTKVLREDCLNVNILVPDTEEKQLSTIVNVHGGGFQFGYASVKPIKTLARTHNIIAVNFNYRLGAFGNLCLGTESVPGNAAMRDQIAMLQWVNKNIAYFGGDPNKVTLSGGSSGAVSVDLLGLSKATKGLFRNIIAYSGNSLNPFSLELDPIAKAALNIAEKVKLPNASDTIQSMENVFKSIPSKHLINEDFIDISTDKFIFVPCIDGHAGDNILTDAPINILKKRDYTQVPILYSYTQMDASMKISLYETIIKTMKDSFSDVLPVNLIFKDDEEKESVGKMAQEFYFKDVPEQNLSIAYMDYFTDILFVFGVLKATELQVEAGNDKVYLLEYSYVNDDSPIIPNTSLRGAGHCAQGQAVWDEDETGLTEEYKAVKHTMRQIWANFIKTGEPSPERSNLPFWPAVSTKLGPVMTVDNSLELKTSLDESRFKRFTFWNNIYAKYYRPPLPPRI